MKKVIFSIIIVFILNSLYPLPYFILKIEKPWSKLVYLSSLSKNTDQFIDNLKKANKEVNAELPADVREKLKWEISDWKNLLYGTMAFLWGKQDKGNYFVLYFRAKEPRKVYQKLVEITKATKEKNVQIGKEYLKYSYLDKKEGKKYDFYIYLKDDGVYFSSLNKTSLKDYLTPPQDRISFKVYLNNIIADNEENILKIWSDKTNDKVVDINTVKKYLKLIEDYTFSYYVKGKNYIGEGYLNLNPKLAKELKNDIYFPTFTLKDIPYVEDEFLQFHFSYRFSGWKTLKKLQRYNVAAYNILQQKISLIKEKTGIDIEKDLFSWLGNRISVFLNNPSSNNSGKFKLPKLVIMIAGNNSDKMEIFLGKLISFFTKNNIIFFQKKIDGISISTTNIPLVPGLAPSFAVIDKNFVISLNSQNIVDVFKKVKNNKETGAEELISFFKFNFPKSLKPFEQIAIKQLKAEYLRCEENVKVLEGVIKKNNLKFKSNSKIDLLKIKKYLPSSLNLGKVTLCSYYVDDNGKVYCSFHHGGVKGNNFTNYEQAIKAFFKKLSKLKSLIAKVEEVFKDDVAYFKNIIILKRK